jgi:methylated-DNA-[protein]-cysteine S-methyltransferase
MTNHFLMESPIGTLTLVKTDGVLSALYMDADLDRSAAQVGTRAESGFEDAVQELEEYFRRDRTVFTIPIAPVGTPFQLRVWEQLRTIPYGETRSYRDLADAIGNRSAMRAVGAAKPDQHHRAVSSRHRNERHAGRIRRRPRAEAFSARARAGRGSRAACIRRFADCEIRRLILQSICQSANLRICEYRILNRLAVASVLSALRRFVRSTR